MTEREIFEQFLAWMGFEVTDKIPLDDGAIAIVYYAKDSFDNKKETRVSCVGYEGFGSGAIFSKDGKLVKGYMDSHVAFNSEHALDIFKLFDAAKDRG